MVAMMNTTGFNSRYNCIIICLIDLKMQQKIATCCKLLLTVATAYSCYEVQLAVQLTIGLADSAFLCVYKVARG